MTNRSATVGFLYPGYSAEDDYPLLEGKAGLAPGCPWSTRTWARTPTGWTRCWRWARSTGCPTD